MEKEKERKKDSRKDGRKKITEGKTEEINE